MRNDEIQALFDQQASSYDERWARTSPIRTGLHFLLEAMFGGLRPDARILCIGAGTGEEIDYLAKRFPHWTFVAVDPSGAMLNVCRAKAASNGYASRCQLHEGYIDTLPEHYEQFDAATCFLVSQFILEHGERTAFFRAIALRLRPGGLLASSDLASDVGSEEYDALITAWFRMMAGAGVPATAIDQMRQAYARDVAILPSANIASIIRSAGFERPVLFYQAALIHAWCSTRAADGA